VFCHAGIFRRASKRFHNQLCVQAFIAEPAVEALHMGVLGWLQGRRRREPNRKCPRANAGSSWRNEASLRRF